MKSVTFVLCLTEKIDHHLSIKLSHAFCLPSTDGRLVQREPLDEARRIESGAFQKPLKVLLLRETYISLDCSNLLLFGEVQIEDCLISGFNAMTIWYVPDSTNEETPSGDLQFKNANTTVGITLSEGKNSTYHKAECIVGNTGYQLVIYDHDLLLRFVKDYFGPFEMP